MWRQRHAVGHGPRVGARQAAHEAVGAAGGGPRARGARVAAAHAPVHVAARGTLVVAVAQDSKVVKRHEARVGVHSRRAAGDGERGVRHIEHHRAVDPARQAWDDVDGRQRRRAHPQRIRGARSPCATAACEAPVARQRDAALHVLQEHIGRPLEQREAVVRGGREHAEHEARTAAARERDVRLRGERINEAHARLPVGVVEDQRRRLQHGARVVARGQRRHQLAARHAPLRVAHDGRHCGRRVPLRQR